MESAYSPDRAHGLWVWMEQHDGTLEDVGLQLLGKGRPLADRLGEPLVAVVLGSDEHVCALAREAAAWGADEALLVAHPLLDHYTTGGCTAALAQAARAETPAVLLMGATPDGRDLAGRLAVRLYTGLTADCTDLEIEPGTGLLIGRVAGFGGGVEALIKCPRHRPQMATVRPGVFPLPVPHAGRTPAVAIRSLDVVLHEEDLQVVMLERVVHRSVDLTRVPVVVVGGAGMRGAFGLLEELAAMVGGEVGASRVAVDQGWAPRERQIGQTGTVVRPKLAITCGVSGASQFTVGIDAAGTVIAINIDSEAPIFEVADYGVVDDLARVLPPLLAELRGAA